MARCANMLCATGISQEYLLFYVTGKSRHARLSPRIVALPCFILPKFGCCGGALDSMMISTEFDGKKMMSFTASRQPKLCNVAEMMMSRNVVVDTYVEICISELLIPPR